MNRIKRNALITFAVTIVCVVPIAYFARDPLYISFMTNFAVIFFLVAVPETLIFFLLWRDGKRAEKSKTAKEITKETIGHEQNREGMSGSVGSLPAEGALQGINSNEITLTTLFFSIKNGANLYQKDFSAAVDWANNAGETFTDHRVGAKYFERMMMLADEKSIWRETWGYGRQALVCFIHIQDLDGVQHALWRIGRAHLGMRNAKLANLYFDAALLFTRQREDKKVHCRVLLDKAVLTHMCCAREMYLEVSHQVTQLFFPDNTPIDLARPAAVTLFNEAKRLQQWRDDADKPIRTHLTQALSLYAVSLLINEMLHDSNGIAFTLFNIGDIWRDLGDLSKAKEHWRRSLPLFEELHDQCRIDMLNERLNVLSQDSASVDDTNV